MPYTWQAKLLQSSTVKNRFAISIPDGYFESLDPNWDDLLPGQIFGVLLAEDGQGNIIKNQRVDARVYGNPGEFLRYEFTLPENAESFQFHLYKDVLLKENFLLKFLVK